jgi:F0F1-type ATP synthase assembly protein I
MRGFHQEVGKSVGAGAEGASFFSSILAGLLLGLLGDWWLGTEPLLVIVGIIAGFGTGFWKMWLFAKREYDKGR